MYIGKQLTAVMTTTFQTNSHVRTKSRAINKRGRVRERKVGKGWVKLTEGRGVNENGDCIAADTEEQGNGMRPDPGLNRETDHDPLCENEAREGDGHNVQELLVE